MSRATGSFDNNWSWRTLSATDQTLLVDVLLSTAVTAFIPLQFRVLTDSILQLSLVLYPLSGQILMCREIFWF